MAGIQARLTEDEVAMLKSFKSKDFNPETEIPAIEARLKRLLDMRQKNWTNIPPGTSVGTPDPDDKIKVMLVGLGGVGKSRLGTVLVGGADPAFKSSDTADSETKDVGMADCEFEDQQYTVYDTPGYVMKDLFGNKFKPTALSETHQSIEKGLKKIGEGLHVIAFVISAGNSRVYEAEIEIMQEAMILNPKTFQHCMIIVTHSKSKYDKDGRRKFLADIKKSDTINKLLNDIDHRVVLVELGSKLESYPSDTSLNTYAYHCERDQVQNMVFGLVAKVVEGNRNKKNPILYLRKYMQADIEKARSSIASKATGGLGNAVAIGAVGALTVVGLASGSVGFVAVIGGLATVGAAAATGIAALVRSGFKKE